MQPDDMPNQPSCCIGTESQRVLQLKMNIPQPLIHGLSYIRKALTCISSAYTAEEIKVSLATRLGRRCPADTMQLIDSRQ